MSNGRKQLKKKANKRRSGPLPDKVKIEVNWEDAVKKALKKHRPKDGWPDSKAKKDEP